MLETQVNLVVIGHLPFSFFCHRRRKKARLFLCRCLQCPGKWWQQGEGAAFPAGRGAADPSPSLPEGGGHGGGRHQHAQWHSGLQVPPRPPRPLPPCGLSWAQSLFLPVAGLRGAAGTATCSSTASPTPRPFLSSPTSSTTPSPFCLGPSSCTLRTTGPTSSTTSCDCCTTRGSFCGCTHRTSTGWREVRRSARPHSGLRPPAPAPSSRRGAP